MDKSIYSSSGKVRLAAKKAIRDYPKLGVKQGDYLNIYHILPDESHLGKFLCLVTFLSKGRGSDTFFITDQAFDWDQPDFETDQILVKGEGLVTKAHAADKVIQMKLQGLKNSEISQHLGVSKGSVEYILRRAGMFRPRSRQGA